MIKYTFLSFLLEKNTTIVFTLKGMRLRVTKKKKIIYLTEINFQIHEVRLRAEKLHSVIF